MTSSPKDSAVDETPIALPSEDLKLDKDRQHFIARARYLAVEIQTFTIMMADDLPGFLHFPQNGAFPDIPPPPEREGKNVVPLKLAPKPQWNKVGAEVAQTVPKLAWGSLAPPLVTASMFSRLPEVEQPIRDDGTMGEDEPAGAGPFVPLIPIQDPERMMPVLMSVSVSRLQEVVERDMQELYSRVVKEELNATHSQWKDYVELTLGLHVFHYEQTHIEKYTSLGCHIGTQNMRCCIMPYEKVVVTDAGIGKLLLDKYLRWEYLYPRCLAALSGLIAITEKTIKSRNRVLPVQLVPLRPASKAESGGPEAPSSSSPAARTQQRNNESEQSPGAQKTESRDGSTAGGGAGRSGARYFNREDILVESQSFSLPISAVQRVLRILSRDYTPSSNGSSAASERGSRASAEDRLPVAPRRTSLSFPKSANVSRHLFHSCMVATVEAMNSWDPYKRDFAPDTDDDDVPSSEDEEQRDTRLVRSVTGHDSSLQSGKEIQSTQRDETEDLEEQRLKLFHVVKELIVILHDQIPILTTLPLSQLRRVIQAVLRHLITHPSKDGPPRKCEPTGEQDKNTGTNDGSASKKQKKKKKLNPVSDKGSHKEIAGYGYTCPLLLCALEHDVSVDFVFVRVENLNNLYSWFRLFLGEKDRTPPPPEEGNSAATRAMPSRSGSVGPLDEPGKGAEGRNAGVEPSGEQALGRSRSAKVAATTAGRTLPMVIEARYGTVPESCASTSLPSTTAVSGSPLGVTDSNSAIGHSGGSSRGRGGRLLVAPGHGADSVASSLSSVALATPGPLMGPFGPISASHNSSFASLSSGAPTHPPFQQQHQQQRVVYPQPQPSVFSPMGPAPLLPFQLPPTPQQQAPQQAPQQQLLPYPTPFTPPQLVALPPQTLLVQQPGATTAWGPTQPPATYAVSPFQDLPSAAAPPGWAPAATTAYPQLQLLQVGAPAGPAAAGVPQPYAPVALPGTDAGSTWFVYPHQLSLPVPVAGTGPAVIYLQAGEEGTALPPPQQGAGPPAPADSLWWPYLPPQQPPS